MTRADALRDLLAAVEAGKLPPDNTIADTLDQFFPHAYSTLTPEFCGAFGGSVDAAIAFTEAVLPGWFPGMSQNIHHGYWFAWVQDLPGHHFSAVEATPARALLIAALKALIAQEEA